MYSDEATRAVRRVGRNLARRPGYAVAVAASLALGIGPNVAVFAIVEQSLFRELPYSNSERLVAIGTSRPEGTSWLTSSRDFYAWKARGHPLESITWIREAASGTLADNPDDAVAGATAAANLVDVIGTRPAIGRWYTDAEAKEGAAVVVLSDELWRTRLSSDRAVLGRALLRVDGRLMTVIGVLAPGVLLPTSAAFWYPSGDHISVQAIGRMRSGTSLPRVQQELSALATTSAASNEKPATTRIVVSGLRDRLFGDIAPVLRLFGATVFLVLLLASANVGNLCLVRALQRRHELAVCAALGASRRRISSLIVLENSVLVVVAMISGVALSALIAAFIVHRSPQNLAAVQRAGILHTVIFATVCVPAITLFISWGPVLASLRGDVRTLISGGGYSSAGSQKARWLRSTFVVAQLTIALVLLIGCGLLVRSMIRLTQIDIGFDRHGLIISRFRFVVPDNGGSRRSTITELAEAMRSLPGVRSAAVGPPPLVGGHGPRLSDGFSTVFSVRDSTKTDGSHTNVWVKDVDASYLRTFRIEILAGRGITEEDDERHPAVALINAAAARLFFPNARAIGSRLVALPTTESGGRPVTIVGVLRDVRQRDLNLAAAPEVWLPIAQQMRLGSEIDISVRSEGQNIEAIGRAARELVGSIGTAVQLRRISTMDAIIRETLAPQRFVLTAFIALASVALALATIGVYSVIAYLTAMRTREIGVRIALGAPRRWIIALVTREGLILAAIGVLIGLPLAWISRRAVAGFLYDVETWDIVTVAASVMAINVTTVAAALIPAQRAARIDPAAALREE